MSLATSPHEYFDANVTGAQNVARYADQVGCRNIFFMSSTSPYGSTDGPKDESSPLYPESAYGMSKLAAELVLEGGSDKVPTAASSSADQA